MVVTIQIFVDRHFMITNTTEDRLNVKFIFLPRFLFMSCFFVALITRKIFITAFEFYGDHIQRRVVMNTTGMLINCFSPDHMIQLFHCAVFCSFTKFETFCQISCAISPAERSPLTIKIFSFPSSSLNASKYFSLTFFKFSVDS
jgi:hypothetical protein